MARVFTDAGGQILTGPSASRFNCPAFSVAFWLYRTATPAAERNLISSYVAGGGWVVDIQATTNLLQAYYTYTTTDKIRRSTTVPALNTWVHVVATHENRGLTDTDWLFYFNGKQEAGTSVGAGSGTHSGTAVSPFLIGSDAATGFLAPPANIGPVAFWSRAISPAECLALAGGAHPLRFKEGLVEMFDMQSGNGELGQISSTYLARGTTSPTSAAVNPPMEPMPSSLYAARQNYRTRRARYFAGGGALFNQAIAATSTFAASLSKAANYARTLPAASAFTATIARTALYLRTLAVASTFGVALSRLVARFRALAASGAWTAALTKSICHPVTLAASGTWTAAIARARGLLMAVSSAFSVSLTKRAFYFRALAVASTFGVVLQRCITKPLAVASTFVVSLVKGRLTLKTLAATSAFTAAITKRLTYARALIANSAFVALISKRLFLSQLLAVASPFTAVLSRRWLKNIGLAVSSVFAALLAKVKTSFGLETTVFTGNISIGPRFNGLTLIDSRFDGTADLSVRFHGSSTTASRFHGTPDITPMFDGEDELRPAA